MNAALPGDTVDIIGTGGHWSAESLTVRTSGISIVGLGGQASIQAGQRPALVLDHVSNVTVSNVSLNSVGSTVLEVIGSTGVTFDSGAASQFNNNAPGVDSLTIDGASSNVTVSRTYLDVGFSHVGGNAINVSPGASNITLAGNILANTGILATSVSGLNVTGNTIQRACRSAVDVEGSSSGVHLENNLFEDSNVYTDPLGLLTSPGNCAAYSKSWDPDVALSAGSTATSTADYNDFYIYGTNATAPYSWAGTTYPTLPAFQSGVAQGLHDTNDTKQAARPGDRTSGYVDVRLQAGSAAISSADLSAPGMLSSDFYGTSPYTSRGAVQFNSNPGLAVAMSGELTSAYGLSLRTTITSDTTNVSLHIAWGDGTSTDASGYGVMDVNSPHRYTKLGTYTITASVADDSGNTVSNSVRVATAGSAYTAFGPTRLLDTRDGSNSPRVGGYSTTRLQIVGSQGIPAGVTAAVLNVTVTDTTSAGHVTVYGEGSPVPTTSNVNYTTGQTVPNMVVVPVGADGYVDLYNAGNPLDLVIDITGYFVRSAAAGYTPVSPSRLVDTRNGTGASQAQVGANQSIPVQIAGAAGGQLPGSGITAVALNVTVTNPRDNGHLTVYPGGQQAPTASNLNFTVGETVANSVVVPVGSDGTIRVLNGAWAPSDVIVDVVGYYSADGKSAYVPISPSRLLDTRDTTQWQYGPLGSWSYVYMPLSAHDPDITGFVLNATVTNTRAAGHLSVAPDPNSLSQYQSGTAPMPPAPGVSSLNWAPGATVPNLVQATGGANGIVDLWNASDGPSDLIVDMFGFYQND